MSAIGKARTAARTAAFVGASAGLLSAFELARRVHPGDRDRLLQQYRMRWLRAVLRIFRVRLEMDGSVPPASGRARLVVANHRHALDIPIVLSLFHGRVLSRADVRDWPLLGSIARWGGTIFVDREKGMSRASAARAIRSGLRDGQTLVVFPEGTTHAGDEVREFHPGAFAGLRDLDVEIVPVGLAYPMGTEFVEDSFVEHLSNTAARSSLRVGIAIGTPVRASAGPREVARTIRESVQQQVLLARAVASRADA